MSSLALNGHSSISDTACASSCNGAAPGRLRRLAVLHPRVGACHRNSGRHHRFDGVVVPAGDEDDARIVGSRHKRLVLLLQDIDAARLVRATNSQIRVAGACASGAMRA